MTDALAGLQQLALDRTARDGLVAALNATRARAQVARTRVEEARARLGDEQADVAALESMSMTRILAGLRGRRDADLDRERAESAAAAYAVADAEARAAVEEREVASLEARIAEYGDLDARRVELLAAREREVRDSPTAAATATRLTELAHQVGELEARAVQLEEAEGAAAGAHAALSQAAGHLGSAGSWATYDTFFGGGFVADMVKHDKLDRAAALMREADAALAHLASELADVGVSAVGGIGISEMTRAFDVWFDNIFSDWAVRDRIAQAEERVHSLLRAVDGVTRDLAQRRTTTTTDLAAAYEERERLLTSV